MDSIEEAKNKAVISKDEDIELQGTRTNPGDAKRPIASLSMGIGPGKKVEMAELTWAEKEKVLRILYTKINMGVSANYWKKMEAFEKARAKLTV